MDICDRGSDGICICCGGEIVHKPGLTSEFLSKRAWGGGVEWSNINKCKVCGFAFHSRGLSGREITQYYMNYRDDTYFEERHASEFFYTRRVHDELELQLASQERRDSLKKYLITHSALPGDLSASLSILDFGGGSGRLITELPGQKYVYDVSGQTPAPNVTGLTNYNLAKMRFGLVICAQMLEHATDPFDVINVLYSYVIPGGYLYIEVPYNETWVDFSGNGRVRTCLLHLAKRYPLINIMLDTYGTAFRVKFNILPPLAYVPVREHLNYFTPQSLMRLGLRTGGSVRDVSRQEHLGTVMLLQKGLSQ
jgi:SAM-dependent methyltransferase